ncbi:peptidoglycan D,D-transpeptidase FtsI family protein [Mobilicoccus pelagius]|uniref:Cell division protein FtsI n=1 Tax=Mobilicoccus pelagius NBRC 104925 TaxID=1089455 RepID=H5UQH0_9MICO|nr:penicillin-binding protein 2 [Mobilicoccus pelagius]GAB47978.1 cell division protein FtsI [Mobilicoccus pelagius NBRC 104925]
MRVLFVVTLFVFTLFAAQLVRLQVVDAGRIAAEGLEVRSERTDLPARRGVVLDTNGVVLASSVERRTVLVDQNLVPRYSVKDPETKKRRTVGVDGAAEAMAPLLGLSVEDMRSRLTGTDLGAVVARRIEPTVWRKIAALEIPGVASQTEQVRTYPGGEPVAPLVGWVGPDGTAAHAGGGLEHLLDASLMGTPGEAVREISRDSRVIPLGQQTIKPAVPGKNVRLTIDQDLQYVAYDAIARQVKELDAESGYAVVLDRRGRLRAAAQYPGFDPDDRSKEGQVFGSLPFQDTFEPGSTAKVMSIGAALAEGKTNPTTLYEVPNRLQRSDPKPFKDSHEHGTLDLTTAGIVAQSSNIGTLLIGEQMPKATLESYYRKFGVGEKTAVGFPGESAGIFAPSSQWNETQWYTLMFGQGVAMTAVQDAGVFQAIANKGVRISPTLVEGTYDEGGRFTAAPAPDPVRVLPPEASEQMSRMLETVVSESGTAQTAAIPGVRIAGKTGTAQDLAKGGFVSSFIGYAPAENPQYVVAVIVNRPGKGKPIYGGTVAGPVFRDIMSFALKKAGARPGRVVPQHYPLDKFELENGIPEQGPRPGAIRPPGAPIGGRTPTSTSDAKPLTTTPTGSGSDGADGAGASTTTPTRRDAERSSTSTPGSSSGSSSDPAGR